MTRSREFRFDLRGGANLSHTADILDRGEVRRARNARAGEYGSLQTRAGTQRVHDTAIGAGATVLGLHQWFPAGGRRLLAVAGGNLYEKLQADEDFTEAATGLSTSVPTDFATHIIAGVPTVFIADGGALKKWDGTNLTTVAGAPDSLLRLAIYKTRMFASDGTKTIYWSDVLNPEEWSSIAPASGGQASVETYSAEGVKALEVVGSSLLLFKQNSVARFTGVGAEDIRVDHDTEGVSADVGTIAPGTVVRMEEVVFFLTDRGPYIASEAGVQAVGVNVEPAFDEAEKDHLPNAVAVHHKARREVWIFFPENEKTTNTVGWCFNYRLGKWTGPWDMGDQFDVASATEFEFDDNSEGVLLGGYDGFVRDGDVPEVGALDDVRRDGTGGVPITMEIELPTLILRDPSAIKRLTPTQWMSADLKTHGRMTIECRSELVPGVQTVHIPSRGPGVKQYPFRPATYGRRLEMLLRDQSGEIVQLNGLAIEADLSRRAV